MALIVRNDRNSVIPYRPADFKSAALVNVARLLWEHRANLYHKVSNLVSSFSGPKKSGKRMKMKVRSGQGTSVLQASSTGAYLSTDNSLRSPTYWSQQSIPQTEGIEGQATRVIGRQFFANGQTGVADALFFGGVGSVTLSPDLLGGRLALIARTYDRYAFRHVRIIYFTTAAATVGGTFALAYAHDAEISTYATPTYVTLFQMEPSVICPFRMNTELEVNYSGKDTWFCEDDATSSASKRMCRQGVFFGYADGPMNTIVGAFMIEYVCDLYQPVFDLGFTLSKLSRMEYDTLNSVLKDLRDPDSDSRTSANTVFVDTPRLHRR